MKKALIFFLFILLFSGITVMDSMAGKDGITPGDVGGTPEKFCKVLKEPNPALLGGWKGVHENYISKLGAYQSEPVEYYLKKAGNRYAIYFFRYKKEGDGKKFSGWRDWEIDGDQIRSETGVRIFAKDGEVYYSFKNDKPTHLTRHEKLK